MDRMADIARWVTLLAAAFLVAQGLTTLARRRVLRGASDRGKALRWRPWGLMQVWTGLAILIGIVPQVLV
jgi:hypothetical protein